MTSELCVSQAFPILRLGAQVLSFLGALQSSKLTSSWHLLHGNRHVQFLWLTAHLSALLSARELLPRSCLTGCFTKNPTATLTKSINCIEMADLVLTAASSVPWSEQAKTLVSEKGRVMAPLFRPWVWTFEWGFRHFNDSNAGTPMLSASWRRVFCHLQARILMVIQCVCECRGVGKRKIKQKKRDNFKSENVC